MFELPLGQRDLLLQALQIFRVIGHEAKNTRSLIRGLRRAGHRSRANQQPYREPDEPVLIGGHGDHYTRA